MESRRVTVCVVLLALCVCARARPEAATETASAPPSSDSANEINSKEVAQTKPDDVKPNTEPTATESAASEKANIVAVANDTATVGKNETVQRVIERSPHAVLFGGTCGGTIISPKWILTAGHCSIFTSGRSVLAGTDDSWADDGVRRRVKRLVIHPLFTVGPYWVDADQFDIKQVGAHWDFMLAELEDPLPLDGKTMAAVALNDQPTIPEGLRVGYAGYGAENHGETMRNEMHSMELQVLPDSKCQQELEQYDPKDMICTQGLPPRYDSACNGDSGSGLVANGTLYGVASWVQDDAHRCFNGALVVFSRVSAVRDWIRQVTKI